MKKLLLLVLLVVSSYAVPHKEINHSYCVDKMDMVAKVTTEMADRDIQIDKKTYQEFKYLKNDIQFIISNCKPDNYESIDMEYSLVEVNDILKMYREHLKLKD